MRDERMFAPLAAREIAAAINPAAKPAKPKPSPVIPAPVDAPACSWRHPRHGEPVAMWPYFNASGSLIAYAARVEYFDGNGERKKDVYPITFCRLDNDGRRHAWRACSVPAPRPLYRLPALLAAPAAPVIICEGEKKADMVPQLFPGWLGTTSMGGAEAAEKSDWTPLAGRPAVINWPDHDKPGAHYSADAARLAKAAGANSVAIVQVPDDWPDGWDLAEALPDGVTSATLAAMLLSAKPWLPPAPEAKANFDLTDEEIQAAIRGFASLSVAARERKRIDEAKRLGLRLSVFDRLVASELGTATTGQGRPLEFPEIEPWPVPMNGAALLTDIVSIYLGHIVMPMAAADALALWVVHTHAREASMVFPRVIFSSVEKRSGKTTALLLTGALSARPLFSANTTAAAIYRTIEKSAPTLLIDEADTFVNEYDDLRGIFNAGFLRGGEVIRTVGDDHEPRRFGCACPVAFAAIGKLPDTMEDRSLKIVLRRRRRDEAITRFRLDRLEPFELLARQTVRWARDNLDRLRQVDDPEVPGELDDRAADCWRPLFAIADVAGGGWPTRSRQAAIEVSGGEDKSESTRITLLADIRTAFELKKVDRLRSADLATHLATLDDRRWPEFRHGKPITQAQIANLLKELRIKPGTIRIGQETPKGYMKADFEDVFERYLPLGSRHTATSRGFPGVLAETEPPQSPLCGGSESAQETIVSAGCGGVAAQKGGADDESCHGPADMEQLGEWRG
jgi:hypothetical protein